MLRLNHKDDTATDASAWNKLVSYVDLFPYRDGDHDIGRLLAIYRDLFRWGRLELFSLIKESF